MFRTWYRKGMPDQLLQVLITILFVVVFMSFLVLVLKNQNQRLEVNANELREKVTGQDILVYSLEQNDNLAGIAAAARGDRHPNLNFDLYLGSMVWNINGIDWRSWDLRFVSESSRFQTNGPLGHPQDYFTQLSVVVLPVTSTTQVSVSLSKIGGETAPPLELP